MITLTKRKLSLLIILTVLYGVLSLAGQVIASKTIVIFGLTTTAGVFFMSGTFPINSIITENFGSKVMRELIFSTLFVLVLVSIALNFAANTVGLDSHSDSAFKSVFDLTTLRVAIASFISYLVSENVTSIATVFLNALNIPFRFIRMILAALVGVSIDSILFINIAFLGVFDLNIIGQLILTLIFFKILITTIISFTLETPRLFRKQRT